MVEIEKQSGVIGGGEWEGRDEHLFQERKDELFEYLKKMGFELKPADSAYLRERIREAILKNKERHGTLDSIRIAAEAYRRWLKEMYNIDWLEEFFKLTSDKTKNIFKAETDYFSRCRLDKMLAERVKGESEELELI